MNPVLEPYAGGRVFELARRLTFAGVELVVGRGELDSRDRLEQLRREKAASGLAVPSLVLGEHSDRGGIADADPAVAASARRDVEGAIGWASELDAGAILVPFFGRGELRGEADLDRAAEAFRTLCGSAGEADVVLCYEGTLPADAIHELANRVASPAFGCYFDVANVVARGMDTATEIRALGPLIRRVHFKDVKVTVGDCPPGRGWVDFAASARALEEIGYDDWIVLETPPGLPELVARDLSFARSVLPSLPRPNWPRFGISTSDFGAGEWEGVIETCRRLGIAALELGGPLLDECLDRPDDVDSVVAALADAGIEVCALAGYGNATVDFLARCLELARRFGTSVVATETRLLETSLAELVPIAEAAGAILALDAQLPTELLGLLERFPSPHLQVVLDPYDHARLTDRFLERFEHRFVLAHFQDVDLPQERYLRFLATRRPDLPLVIRT